MTLPFAFNNFSDIYRLFMGQKNIDVLAFVFWSFHHGISEGDDQRVAIAYKNSIVMGWWRSISTIYSESGERV